MSDPTTPVVGFSLPVLNADADTWGTTNNDNWTLVDTTIGALAAGRNRLINGDFRINQISYASGTTLAAGTYGHDGWKAGASGGDYSFTQLKSDTAVTIATGKTLIQIVEDANVEGGSYVLHWAGTAQARVGTGGSVPSGSYAASPILLTSVPAGQTMSVEFDAGTLGLVQLEPGAIVMPFERLSIATSLSICRRFFQVYGGVATSSNQLIAMGYVFGSGEAILAAIPLAPPMHTSPTLSFPDSLNNYFVGAGGQTTILSTIADYGANTPTTANILATPNSTSGFVIGEAALFGQVAAQIGRIFVSARL